MQSLVLRRLTLGLSFALAALALGACGDDGGTGGGGDENISPILDGFDSGGEPSPCQGITPMAGGACSLPPGSYCPTTVQCACFPTTRTIACECAGGTWVCPQECAGEQPPCPTDDVVDPTDVADTSGDMPMDDTTAADMSDDSTMTDTATTDTTMTDTMVTDTMVTDTSMPDTTMSTNAITASAQVLGDLATRVLVMSVTADEAGWVVIAAGGTVLGQTAVAAGTASGVEVDLTRRVGDGESLTARLHVDLGAMGTWEPGTDMQADDAGGSPVEATFTVTVPGDLPDARLVATSPGDAAWSFGATEPSTVTIVGGGAENQTLTLREGWRYEIVDQGTLTLELVDATDTVLLSEAGGGTLEGDVDIAWSVAGAAMMFTVDADLAAALTGYRDATTTTVAGSITVMP